MTVLSFLISHIWDWIFSICNQLIFQNEAIYMIYASANILFSLFIENQISYFVAV